MKIELTEDELVELIYAIADRRDKISDSACRAKRVAQDSPQNSDMRDFWFRTFQQNKLTSHFDNALCHKLTKIAVREFDDDCENSIETLNFAEGLYND